MHTICSQLMCFPLQRKIVLKLNESCYYFMINGFRIKHEFSLTRGSAWCILWSRRTKWEANCRTSTVWTWWTGASLPAHSHYPGRHDEFQSCVQTQAPRPVIILSLHKDMFYKNRWPSCSVRHRGGWLCPWTNNLLISMEVNSSVSQSCDTCKKYICSQIWNRSRVNWWLLFVHFVLVKSSKVISCPNRLLGRFVHNLYIPVTHNVELGLSSG